MADDRVKVKVHESGGMGVVWFMGWLFTIGDLHLHFPSVLYAILLWPYYLGRSFGH